MKGSNSFRQFHLRTISIVEFIMNIYNRLEQHYKNHPHNYIGEEIVHQEGCQQRNATTN